MISYSYWSTDLITLSTAISTDVHSIDSISLKSTLGTSTPIEYILLSTNEVH